MRRYVVMAAICMICLSMLNACDGTTEPDPIDQEVSKQEMNIDFNKKTYDGLFSGTIDGEGNPVQGKFVSGEVGGKKYLIYDGGWEDNAFKGTGRLETNNYIVHFPAVDGEDAYDRKGKYEGSTIDGEASGEGVFSAKNDEGEKYTYDGEWSNGLFEGKGELVYPKSGLTMNGNYSNGSFAPTFVERVQALGTRKDDCSYSLSKKEISFLEKNEKAFTSHSRKLIKKNGKSKFSVKSFSKNPNSFKPGFVKVSNLEVVQIKERKRWGKWMTFVLAQTKDYETVYSMDIMGKVKKVVEGSMIDVFLLPIDYSTYKNVSNDSVWAVVGMAARIDKR